MKKVMLLLVVVCNLAIAGGVEGTGNEPEGTSSTDGSQYKLMCIKTENKNEQNTYCILVKVQTKS
ncbi:MAG: hypothetical protein JKY19_12695 [Alcanivoracaceae bacterium]|nr:hypothetical protein [Alcanivoracaceae bacterium]